MTCEDIPASSVQYVDVGVRWVDPIAGELDPTDHDVEIAFADLADGEPASGDYVATSWASSSPARLADGVSYYLVRPLVGPGTDHALTVGVWRAWCRITVDSPAETPVVKCGTVRVVDR